MKYELRDFQALNKAQIRTQFTQHRSCLYVAGTGSGKTVTACSVIEDAVAKGNPVWFVAHRRELIDQASYTLFENGVMNSSLMAGRKYDPSSLVQVCSIDTIRSRLIQNERLLVIHKPKLFVFDEAHRSLSKSYRDLMDYFPDAYRLGLTATPVLSSGIGMGHIYDSMVKAPPVRELIDRGFLVEPRYFTSYSPDLTGIPTQDYDYHQRTLQQRFNHADLRGDAVEQWIRHAEGRKTVLFTTGLKHNKALEQDFRAVGIKAKAVDGRMLKSERSDIFQQFKETNDIDILINCNLVVEGYDVPEVGCVQIVTATKSIGRYIQMGGRCLRPFEGKNDCIIVDHGGNIKRHGFVDEPIPWTLDTNGKIQDAVREMRDREQKQFTCDECGCIFSGRIRCPECGTRLEVKGQHELITSPEELIEIKRGADGDLSAKGAEFTDSQKRHFYAQLRHYANKNNPSKKQYKIGWVRRCFEEKFGHSFEGFDGFAPEPAGDLVKAFIRAKNARYHILRRVRNEQQ